MPNNLPNIQQVEHFDSCFQVITAFMDVLQRSFKEDTRYSYPLIPPQSNTLYVLDENVAHNMKSYISVMLRDTCGICENDFRITERSSGDAGGLYRLRLEFIEGVNFEIISRIIEKTSLLEERILQRKHAQ